MGETAGVASVEATAEERLKSEWGRLVASYMQNDPQATLSVHLAPNQPQIEGRQVLIVDRDHDSWTATIDLELHVRQGLVDVLRFDVPSAMDRALPARPGRPTGVVADSQRKPAPIGHSALWRRSRATIRCASAGSWSLRWAIAWGWPTSSFAAWGNWKGSSSCRNDGNAKKSSGTRRGSPTRRSPANCRNVWHCRPGCGTFHVLGEHFQASLKNIEHTPQLAARAFGRYPLRRGKPTEIITASAPSN